MGKSDASKALQYQASKIYSNVKHWHHYCSYSENHSYSGV